MSQKVCQRRALCNLSPLFFVRTRIAPPGTASVYAGISKSLRATNARKVVRIRQCVVATAKLEEIDPLTGEVVAGTNAASLASEFIKVGPYTWAYRKAIPDSSSSGQIPVLCIHGLGSHSYTYRNTVRLLAEAGHPAYALDWIGHGASDKPVDGFDYSVKSYVRSLKECISHLPIQKPFALVVQGFVLGQAGLLYALEDEESVSKLVILNTPLSLKSKLRPELAAYQNPIAFMRPKPGTQFQADYYNAAGGPYALAQRDADAYNKPYVAGPAASAAIEKTMKSLDFKLLLESVNDGYCTWKKPSLVVWGGSDTLLDLKNPLDWLESKRTCMRLATGIEAKLGHNPQEDYPQAFNDALVKFLQ